MIANKILILYLLVGSIGNASEPIQTNNIQENTNWEVKIWSDGTAVIYYGSIDMIQAPVGSFDLNQIIVKLGPLVNKKPNTGNGINVYNSSRADQVGYYTENIEYAKELIKKVFDKSQVLVGNVKRFDRWLEKDPPLGLQLYFDEKQIQRGHYPTPPGLRRPPPIRILPEWATVARRYPLFAEVVSAAPLLLDTPWPYLSLLILILMAIRRYRINKRAVKPVTS